ncbi:hypothetical protein CEXT_412931 [Caerostris extrusa]|uniref:Uncharacterized protein n=1 Tax=Caerostris extrusa TaxID=172846 RepID=A0AAV4N9C7_CAEEX|nr:hypothetical protein CEXT_412931 [Caerostris extrusa]
MSLATRPSQVGNSFGSSSHSLSHSLSLKERNEDRKEKSSADEKAFFSSKAVIFFKMSSKNCDKLIIILLLVILPAVYADSIDWRDHMEDAFGDEGQTAGFNLIQRHRGPDPQFYQKVVMKYRLSFSASKLGAGVF